MKSYLIDKGFGSDIIDVTGKAKSAADPESLVHSCLQAKSAPSPLSPMQQEEVACTNRLDNLVTLENFYSGSGLQKICKPLLHSKCPIPPWCNCTLGESNLPGLNKRLCQTLTKGTCTSSCWQ